MLHYYAVFCHIWSLSNIWCLLWFIYCTFHVATLIFFLFLHSLCILTLPHKGLIVRVMEADSNWWTGLNILWLACTLCILIKVKVVSLHSRHLDISIGALRCYCETRPWAACWNDWLTKRQWLWTWLDQGNICIKTPSEKSQDSLWWLKITI